LLVHEQEQCFSMSAKKQWFLCILYASIFGSYCGLEIDTFAKDISLFHINSLWLFFNVLLIPLSLIIVYVVFAASQRLWTSRIVSIAISGLMSICFHLAIFFALYKSVRKLDFDFYFFWYNTDDALPALWNLYAPWFPLTIFSLIAFTIFQKQAYAPLMRLLKKSPQKGCWTLAALFLFCGLCQFLTIDTVRGSASGFIYKSFISDRRLRTDYPKLYKKHIAALQLDAPAKTKRFDPSILGDNIFVVKQESLNGLLTGPKVTPQLLRASQDGIFFPKFYGNSVQSLRGYECILCGVPPSAAGPLVDEYPAEEIKKLACLPQVFHGLGYHTLYFFGGSRNPRIVRFAESIGFEKVLADDIVQPEDVKYDWGYREDVFFTRVFQYLQKHYVNQKTFVFVDTGATNHAPFKILDKGLINKVPFPIPEKYEEKLSNTTFVQDTYFGHFYDLFKEQYAAKGSLIAVSDHSYPIPVHPDNSFNERGAYEENFMISFLFVPTATGKTHFNRRSTVAKRFSQMDILPTMLDLIGMEQKSLLGESFAPWLRASPRSARSGPSKMKISIQPYEGGYISAIKYPQKYLFDVCGRNTFVYDLATDPGEVSPSVHKIEEYLPLIREFFRNSGPSYYANSLK
jgi:hypothetical protein